MRNSNVHRSKKKIKIISLISATLLICVILISVYSYNKALNELNCLTQSDSSSKYSEGEGNSLNPQSESSETEKNTSQQNYSENNYKDGNSQKDNSSTQKSKKTSHNISVPYILQNPELPTGCEVTSLTMVLNYLGYNVSKTEIASKYLKKSTDFYTYDGKDYGPNFYTTFPGDPFTQQGYGCLAPAITNTATSYFESNGHKNVKAKDISGTSPHSLYEYVNNDIPVIVWATMNMREVKPTDSWYSPEGKLLTWPGGEHCLVLIGYDKDTVIVNDPLIGKHSYPRELFEKRYLQLNSQAVIVE